MWRSHDQPALRLGFAIFLAAFAGDADGADLPAAPSMLALKASIKLTTLVGADFFAAVMGRPFCFFLKAVAAPLRNGPRTSTARSYRTSVQRYAGRDPTYLS
jgi:hypothetical protein